MAYRNSEYYSDPTAGTVFDKKNIDKWRVVKIEPDPAAGFRKARRKVDAAAQRLQQEQARKKKLKRGNTDLKNRLMKLERLGIYVNELCHHVINSYVGDKTEEQRENLRRTRMETIASINRLRGIISCIGWDNGMDKE